MGKGKPTKKGNAGLRQVKKHKLSQDTLEVLGRNIGDVPTKEENTEKVNTDWRLINQRIAKKHGNKGLPSGPRSNTPKIRKRK